MIYYCINFKYMLWQCLKCSNFTCIFGYRHKPRTIAEYYITPILNALVHNASELLTPNSAFKNKFQNMDMIYTMQSVGNQEKTYLSYWPTKGH